MKSIGGKVGPTARRALSIAVTRVCVCWGVRSLITLASLDLGTGRPVAFLALRQSTGRNSHSTARVLGCIMFKARGSILRRTPLCQSILDQGELGVDILYRWEPVLYIVICTIARQGWQSQVILSLSSNPYGLGGSRVDVSHSAGYKVTVVNEITVL